MESTPLTDAAPSWDAALLRAYGGSNLVSIGREGRLVLEDARGPRRVDLCWVDEVALVLVDLAIGRKQRLSLVYPAPAGEVAVLLAAQLLVHQFLRRVPSPSVGILTGDTTMAARTWQALRFATAGGREPIANVFPCVRARPEGEAALAGRPFRGVIIGQRCSGWPVDHLIVDHLSGYVDRTSHPAVIEIFSDPRDPGLREAETSGRLLWGWSEADLALWDTLEHQQRYTVPFSVASDRLRTMARGVTVTLVVCRHEAAEAALARCREDLRLLRSLSPERTDRNLERGLSVAWHHLTTLVSLPCKPTQFDYFSGVPPIAARSTRTFEPELKTWATTLRGDAQEIATILAGDIGDLRACLDDGNPFEAAVRELGDRRQETLAVTRTHTAANALLSMLGIDRDKARDRGLTVCALGRLHRQGTWPQAVMIGEPSPWDWHSLLSGIAPELRVLALGERSATACATAVSEVRAAGDHWGAAAARGPTWRALLRTNPPAERESAHVRDRAVVVIGGPERVAQPDPFESLSALFELDPLDISGEGPNAALVRDGEAGEWTAEVAAIEITTDHGMILLEAGRMVEVRVGPKIIDRVPEAFQPGDVLLIGRHQGRVGLIEALEERLRDRPDLLAARLLVDDYHGRFRRQFVQSGQTIWDLHHSLKLLGCDKTIAAVSEWVLGGTMAPQNFEDLRRLNTSLQLGYSVPGLGELWGAVQRRRGFRRSAGRALAASARSATLVDDQALADSETGLSVADLRDAVIQAVVVSTRRCEHPVPVTLLGRLQG